MGSRLMICRLLRRWLQNRRGFEGCEGRRTGGVVGLWMCVYSTTCCFADVYWIEGVLFQFGILFDRVVSRGERDVRIEEWQHVRLRVTMGNLKSAIL